MLNAKNINGVFIKILSLLLPGVSHKSIIKFYIPEIWKTSAFKHKVRIIAHRLTANHTKSHFVMSLCNTPEVRSAIKGKLMMEQAKERCFKNQSMSSGRKRVIISGGNAAFSHKIFACTCLCTGRELTRQILIGRSGTGEVIERRFE